MEQKALLAINALLRFLYNHFPGYGPGQLAPLREDPQPDPWRVQAGVQNVVAAVQAKEVAARIKEVQLRESMVGSANGAIAAVLDDFCGTPPPHWPWPVGSPQGWQLVSGLAAAADSLTSAEVRSELFNVAGQAAARLGAGARETAKR